MEKSLRIEDRGDKVLIVSQRERLHWKQHLKMLGEIIKVNRLGIISDFDGTLSHFTLHPEQAEITEANAKALDGLTAKVSLLALLSGRSSADVRARFTRPNLQYYGNHGLDYWHNDGVQVVEAAQGAISSLSMLVEELAASLPEGVLVEDKRVSASVHYRAAANPAEISQHLQQRLEPLCDRYGLQLNAGRFVWEIKPALALDKGAVLQTLVAEHQLECAIFLGDDVTDLTAMQRLRDLRRTGLSGLSVGVTHPEVNPDMLLGDCDVIAYGPDDVAELLGWIDNQLR